MTWSASRSIWPMQCGVFACRGSTSGKDGGTPKGQSPESACGSRGFGRLSSAGRTRIYNQWINSPALIVLVVPFSAVTYASIRCGLTLCRRTVLSCDNRCGYRYDYTSYHALRGLG